jgi:transglutaminase-like putative cysteine protease
LVQSIVAPAGRTRLSANGIVKDTGQPDVVASQAQQHAVEDLPDESLVFLLGSRYCETDRLSEIAWSRFGHTPPGWSRVQAICDYVHQHIAFGCEHARHYGLGKRTAIAPASAGTMHISPSLSAAA